MFTISNILTIARGPLALLFLKKNITVRIIALTLGILTDAFDGFFARKSKTVSKIGTLLDPIMDKFFFIFLLCIFLNEGAIHFSQALMMLSRDFAIMLFTFYLLLNKEWKKLQIKAIFWGKVTTAGQFGILMGLTLGYQFPWFIYSIFIFLGIFALIELFLRNRKTS
ncbi:MAG TPA: CDP-alcohol phosphatidyltransferase family protein [Chlamydiales bacterium]|nr:CDP-alcohol phosphatidyltransferase family protein [Chlamydiales bacterium]